MLANIEGKGVEDQLPEAGGRNLQANGGRKITEEKVALGGAGELAGLTGGDIGEDKFGAWEAPWPRLRSRSRWFGPALTVR